MRDWREQQKKKEKTGAERREDRLRNRRSAAQPDTHTHNKNPEVC